MYFNTVCLYRAVLISSNNFCLHVTLSSRTKKILLMQLYYASDLLLKIFIKNRVYGNYNFSRKQRGRGSVLLISYATALHYLLYHTLLYITCFTLDYSTSLTLPSLMPSPSWAQDYTLPYIILPYITCFILVTSMFDVTVMG